MYEVLVPIDTDEARARAQADAVASLPSATDSIRATVLHVFEDNLEGASVNQVASVRRAAERLGEAAVEHVLRESSGDPAEEILAEASKIDADLVCMAGRKRSPAGKAIFGSVTQTVVLDATRPVLCVGRNENDE